ncbi:Gmad2 immunoglobulin-like domain-containing protein [Nocardioides terrisoli]|uniref:Gmad2 immunoglobulin-like domain-containing protein n=1 Tax=Nocardioides terrisoli TaxID=3388267 RepID=UPI00287B7583|nr:Gmad2 immunoglobulin-like domain-containing protein [Nocardioides marmorisolisilvae]
MNDHEGRMRERLHDAVSDVRPERGVDEIRARLEDRRVAEPRHWFAGTAAAVAAIVLVTGGVAWINHHGKAPRIASSTTGHSAAVVAYYLGATANGSRLFSEHHTVKNVRGSDLEAAVNETLSGLPDDPDYHTGFPRGTSASVSQDGNGVEVDFDDSAVADARPTLGSTAREAIQAVVWTVDDTVSRPVAVRFMIKGQPASRLLGEPLDGSVREGSADSVLSPVSVTLPEGAQLSGGSVNVITGHAAAFEGNVVWELRQGEQVVKSGFTTANECCTLSPYAFELKAPPGNYTLVVHDTDPSGKGHHVTSDSKDIVILPR